MNLNDALEEMIEAASLRWQQTEPRYSLPAVSDVLQDEAWPDGDFTEGIIKQRFVCAAFGVPLPPRWGGDVERYLFEHFHWTRALRAKLQEAHRNYRESLAVFHAQETVLWYVEIAIHTRREMADAALRQIEQMVYRHVREIWELPQDASPCVLVHATPRPRSLRQRMTIELREVV